MRQIYAEKVLESSLDEVYDDWCCSCESREDCPAMKRLYARLELLRRSNIRRMKEKMER